jgi:serine/threonine protein phosphatase PrpC
MEGGMGGGNGVRTLVRTDVGVVRERNEDAAYVDPDGRFAVLADGMGGHSAGDIASNMAVEILRQVLERESGELNAFASAPAAKRRRRVRNLVERGIRIANDAILERSQAESDKRGMGTTLEVVLVLGGVLFVGHVGDSRTYLVRKGEITQLTEDHTVAERMRRAGTWSDEEAAASPMRSALSSAVGVVSGFVIDHADVVLEPGDRVLVCSDGLYDYFSEAELAEAIGGDTADLDALIAEARARGGHDNITGVVLELDAGAPTEELDEAPTNPISVPLDPVGPAGPLHGMGEQTMTDLLERVLGSG